MDQKTPATTAMLSTEPMPGWPPPKDKPIGVERARFYVRWMKVAARPLVAEAEQILLNKFPDGVITTESLSIEKLAARSINAYQPNLCIGSVWCKQPNGSQAEMAIWIDQKGCLVLKESLGMTDRQLW